MLVIGDDDCALEMALEWKIGLDGIAAAGSALKCVELVRKELVRKELVRKELVRKELVRRERDFKRDESALVRKGRERACGARWGSSGCIRDTSLLWPLAHGVRHFREAAAYGLQLRSPLSLRD